MAIGTHEDGVVARGGARFDPPADLGCDPIGFLRTRGKHLEADRGRIGNDPLRTEALDHPGLDLQPIRVVEADESIGGVEDRRQRPIVAPQDDRPDTDVAILERQDIVHGRSPERIDGLVVVAHDGHVAVTLGESSHQLCLGPVRVLEFVHEDVSEAPRDRRASLCRGPHETQRKGDLVPEVDAAAGGHQRLVGPVGTSQL